ncbi:hypothetical protein ACOSP7_026550 [Xanthoceras sorbifolium]
MKKPLVIAHFSPLSYLFYQNTTTLFEVVYTTLPKHALDLVPLPKLLVTANMAERIKENLEQTNRKYKAAAHMHMTVKMLEEGELVMAHLRKNRFQ